MCRRITCDQCNKPSYAGCGAHVEQVLAGVPKADRCRCREAAPLKRDEKAGAASASWRERLFGK